MNIDSASGSCGSARPSKLPRRRTGAKQRASASLRCAHPGAGATPRWRPRSSGYSRSQHERLRGRQGLEATERESGAPRRSQRAGPGTATAEMHRRLRAEGCPCRCVAPRPVQNVGSKAPGASFRKRPPSGGQPFFRAPSSLSLRLAALLREQFQADRRSRLSIPGTSIGPTP